MSKNYKQLKDMLMVTGYNVSIFEDAITDIIGEYFLVDTNNQDFSISVFQEDNIKDDGRVEVLVEERIESDWHEVDQKYYKTSKGAYKFITKLLAEL